MLFFYPMFANYVHVFNEVFHVSEKYFPPTCCEIAGESDWNNRISQNIQNLGFSEKKKSFSKKNLNFLKIAYGGKFAIECVSNGFLRQSYETF